MRYNNFIIVSFQILKKIVILLSYILFLCFSHSYAQEKNYSDPGNLKAYAENIYSADQNLINGIKYENYYPKAQGNAFFNEDVFSYGYLIVNNILYLNQKLKYDICNQQLLLLLDEKGKYEIILNNSAISEFSIGDKKFKKYFFKEKGFRFFQELSTGKSTCLYYWEKDFIPVNNSLESAYRYGSQHKDSYLLIADSLMQFRNKKTFIRCFPENHSGIMNGYIRKNKLNIKHITDEKMAGILRFYDGLISNGNKVNVK